MIVIEPGTQAWDEMVEAVQQGRKLSLMDEGCRDDKWRVCVKVGEGMWSPPIVAAVQR